MASRNMTALLTMLAIAGWQNRERLGELLAQVTGQAGAGTGANPGAGSPSKSMPGGLGGLLGGLLGNSNNSGQVVSGGLGELLDSFTGSGHGEVADSWVQTGPNKEVDKPQITDALGDDTIDQLAKQTGLSRDELLSRLQSILPTAVDKLTPKGRLPTQDEASQW